MIVPIVRSSPASIATIAWRTPRLRKCSASAGEPNGGVISTAGLSASTSAANASATAGSTGCITARWSPGPSVVRSGVPSEPNRMTSATSERNASSERDSRPSIASATSGERDSVRLAS